MEDILLGHMDQGKHWALQKVNASATSPIEINPSLRILGIVRGRKY
jgi:hypothetical protein